MPDSDFGGGTSSAATPQIRRIASPMISVRPNVTIRNALPSRPVQPAQDAEFEGRAERADQPVARSRSATQKLPVSCTAE